MAGAVELAQGYVSLSVSTRGVGTEINNVFRQSAQSADRHGKNAGENFGRGFNRGSNSMLKDAAKLVAVGVIVRRLSKGFPDLTMGIEGATRKMTGFAAAGTAVMAMGGPLLGLVGGLASGLAAAGAGAAAFGALLKPAFTEVFEGVSAATAAEKAYNTALASGDKAGAQKALDQRTAALAQLNPAQRKAAEATIGLTTAFRKQSESFATPYLIAYTRGVGTLQGLLPQLEKVAKPAGEAVLQIFNRANKAAQGPGMKRFTDFLARETGPAILRLSDIVANLGVTIGNVFMAATPVLTISLNVLKELTGELRNASGAGGGLKEFFTSMQGPIVKLGDLISNLVGFVGDFIIAASPIAGPVLDAVNSLVTALRTLVNGSDFAGFVVNIGKALQLVSPLFDVLARVVGKVFKALSGQLLAVLPILIPAIADFAIVLGDTLIGLSPLLPSLIKLAAALLTGVLPAIYPIVTIIRKALIPVVDLLTKAVEFLTPYIGKLVSQFQKATEPGGQFSKVIKIVAGVVMDFAQRALPVVLAVFREVVGFIKTEVIPRAIGIGEAFRDLFNVVAPIVLAIARTIVNTFKKNLPVIREIWATIKSIITGAMDLVKAVIQQVTKAISFIWRNFGGIIMKVISTVFDTVIKVVRSALKIVRSVISLATNIIKGNWKGAWEDVKKILKNAWEIIKTTIRGAFKIVKTIFGGFLTYIGTKFKTKYNETKEMLLKPIREAKEKLATMLGAGKTGIQSLFTKAVTGIGNALDKVKNKAKTPINFVIGTVYNDGIRKALNLIPGVNFPKADLIGAGGSGNTGAKIPVFGQGTTRRTASGGVLGGFAPGYDTKRYKSDTGEELHIGGGEAVMTPWFTKMVGGAKGVDRLNALARKVVKFAGGGVFAGGANVVSGRQNQHRSGYPWARWAGDIPAPMGTSVYAWKDGIINSVRHLTTSYGKHLRAQYGNTEMLIAHLSRILVSGGQRVKQGQKIAEVGSTGNSSGPHAHVEFKGGVGKLIAGIAGGVSKVMDWIGSPTQKVLAGLAAKMTRGIKGMPFGNEAIAAGKHGIKMATDYAKNAPAALWNQVQDMTGSGKSAIMDFFTNSKSEQMRNAAVIAEAGSGMGRRAQIIGIATSIVETGLRNLRWGDRDSVGLFQQRAPWGSFAARTNPRTAAEMFFHGGRGGQPGLDDIRGWASMDMGRAAQRVQVSAFPGRYAQEIGKATSILDRLKSKAFAGGGVIDPMAAHLMGQMGIRTGTFDSGNARLKPGYTLAYNGTGRDEVVRHIDQTNGPMIQNLTLVSRNENPKEDMDAIAYKVRVLRRSGVSYRGVE